MNICIVSTDYPAPSHPKYVFVEQLVNEMVNQGVDISVIAPQSITRHLLKGDPLLAVDSEKKIGNRSYHIYRPKYLTLGNAPRWIQNILEWLRYKVILRVITKHNLKPDAIYGHFWQNAFDIRKYCYRMVHHCLLLVVKEIQHWRILSIRYLLQKRKGFPMR